MINIGAAFGPMIAAPLRGEINWDAVFIAGAVITAVNFIPTLFFFKEPERKPPEPGEKREGPLQVFLSSVMNLFTDLRLLIFLLIFSCFWLMLQQLWDLMPNFIDEWVDTSDLAPVFGWFRADWLLESGQVKPEMVMAINSVSIILLVILVSWLVGKINKIAAMVIGMIISVVGFVGTGATSIGLACAFMLLIFSIGEMTCSPTFTAYVALIAPKARKALYMGYAQLPLAIGWSSGNKIGGWLYENMASKFNLARQYMTEQLGMDPAAVMDKARLPETQVMDALAAALGGSDGPVTWKAATQVLWDQYEPYMVWYYLGLFGAVGTVGMVIFYFITRRGKQENHTG
jgi:dipeptide/tripeptide permease